MGPCAPRAALAAIMWPTSPRVKSTRRSPAGATGARRRWQPTARQRAGHWDCHAAYPPLPVPSDIIHGGPPNGDSGAWLKGNSCSWFRSSSLRVPSAGAWAVLGDKSGTDSRKCPPGPQTQGLREGSRLVDRPNHGPGEMP